MIKFEVCCGSVEDCITALKGGADRIELNSALYLGGLTPSYSTVLNSLKKVDLPIVCMVRCRADGFNYNDIEFETMFDDAKFFIENGASGIAFGFLNEDLSIDLKNTKKMVDLIHSYNKEAVFHMAIDLVKDIDNAMNTLIELKVDRVLTKGQSKDAYSGMSNIAYMQNNYGDKIEILAGAGINSFNVKEILTKTNVKQVHASCKSYKKDITSFNGIVDFRNSENGYEIVDLEKVINLKKEII